LHQKIFRYSAIHRGLGVHCARIGYGGGRTLQPHRITFGVGASYITDPIRHAGEEFVRVLGSVYRHLGGEQGLLTAHAYTNSSPTIVAGLVGADTPPW
jgi:hypothetical protein